ncbi:MT-A70-domain-containing protein [Lobosporangium transversale]|uniref:MT-A70-domain-containing protein n=1 Tax=Lobosporangium transversale TaxID=64571 RepID=A0A1Y2GK21_9FUNG|nr:MT-A70-domain-containing protein [Lobosporangium transversale]ORZ12070.1 MT-A70-domain-containing protein [Lobosporangium transversale]|eukprot:XP_021879935.1 MT-A70-domain-containing protein [Lobosporangium transversale]
MLHESTVSVLDRLILISHISLQTYLLAKDREGFDIIVMDPPWQNASVDRMSHYRTMDLYELFKIPIPDLLKANGSNVGGIVAVWITNKAKVKRVVVEKLFPAWGLDLVAHWFWLKVTTKGEPVLSLSNSHRRAYEGVLIGRQRQGSKLSNKTMHETSASNPVNRLLVSIPAQHSRKPSLNALIEEEFFTSKLESRADRDRNAYVDSEALVKKPLYRLELFARNLEEGVLSWGNEPLRYQYCGRGASNSQVVQDGYLIPCPIQSELVSQ